MRWVLAGVASVLAVLAAAGGPAWALETDQFYAWGRSLPDSSEVVNAKLNLELERALASFDPGRPPDACIDVAVRLRKRLRFILFHHIQMWAMKTSLVPRVPADPEEERRYREVNLYHNHGPFDIGTWMPIVPTIEMDGVRFGTDKLAHFFSSGWTMFRSFNRARRRGLTIAEAERSAVRRGILEERTILGGMTSGLVSVSDLEAGYQGMRFYRDLCGSEGGIVDRVDGEWKIRRRIDLRDYVSPEWDESYQPPIFRKWRWRKVRPVIAQYCELLSDPQVVAMRRRYRARDRVTLVEELIADLVDRGSMPDPWRFSIEAVCDEPLRSEWGFVADLAAKSGRRRPAQPEELHARRIVAHEASHGLRRIGLLNVGVAHPEVVSGSVGVIFFDLPLDHDCHSPCNLRGPFVQVAPGLGGGRLSVGYGRVIGELGDNELFLAKVFLAMGAKATVLRTWGEATRDVRDQTYLGPELEFSVAKVNFELGLLRRIDGSSGDRWLFTGGVGWGF